MKHILIHFQDTRPEVLDELDHDCHIWLFLPPGRHQIPLDWCRSLCRFRHPARFIPLTSAGQSAADLMTAYYLGRMSALDPAADICLLSADRRQDVLIHHVRQENHCADLARLT